MIIYLLIVVYLLCWKELRETVLCLNLEAVYYFKWAAVSL